MPFKSPRRFFDSVKAGILGPTLSETEVSGCNAILEAMEGSPLAYTAYALGTTYHETDSTMQPVRERGGPIYFFRMYDIQGARPKVARDLGNLQPGDGAKYHGRGYPQVTGRRNYQRAKDVFGIDFIGNPDKMLDPILAGKVMRLFMDKGWFTGRSFSSYLPASGPASTAQFTAARRIINGTDKATKIASHAVEFQRALQAGEWS